KLKSHFFWYGFLFAAPLVFKITWIHFIVAYVPVFAFTVFPQLRKQDRKIFLYGVLLGTLVAFLNLLKNCLYFSISLYPSAASLFSTPRAGPIHVQFWEKASRKTPSLYGFLVAWQGVGAKLISKALLFTLALVTFMLFKKVRKQQIFSSDLKEAS